MEDKERDTDIFRDDTKYLKGTENWIIRYYYYLSAGLNELNAFRNLFIGILTIYITFKLESYWYAIIIFTVSIVVLTLIGYYFIHKVSKVRDWLGIRFSSYFGRQQINYIEENYKLLEEIRNLLKK